MLPSESKAMADGLFNPIFSNSLTSSPVWLMMLRELTAQLVIAMLPSESKAMAAGQFNPIFLNLFTSSPVWLMMLRELSAELIIARLPLRRTTISAGSLRFKPFCLSIDSILA